MNNQPVTTFSTSRTQYYYVWKCKNGKKLFFDCFFTQTININLLLHSTLNHNSYLSLATPYYPLLSIQYLYCQQYRHNYYREKKSVLSEKLLLDVDLHSHSQEEAKDIHRMPSSNTARYEWVSEWMNEWMNEYYLIWRNTVFFFSIVCIQWTFIYIQ